MSETVVNACHREFLFKFLVSIIKKYVGAWSDSEAQNMLKEFPAPFSHSSVGATVQDCAERDRYVCMFIQTHTRVIESSSPMLSAKQDLPTSSKSSQQLPI